jgi:2-methylcitrate dehydratase PrpD
MAKHLHSGKACSNGIFSAFLARNGFKGSSRILEGERGFLAASSQATPEDIRNLTVGLADPFLITRNFFKRHACCRGCFEGIEGIDRILISHGLRPGDIEEIVVTMKPMRTWLVGIESPADIYEAKFSLPFCMALKVIKKGAGLYDFNTENLHDPGVRGFMKRIKLRRDPEIVARARIQVVCKDRTEFVEEPVCQSLSLEEVEKKFIDHMSPILKEQEIEWIVSMTNGLETIGHIGEMTRMLKKITIRRNLR